MISRDFLTEEIDGIVVDNAEARDRIIATMRRVGVPKMASRVKFYNGIEPIFDYYHINEQLKTVFQREVKLPSGGAIVIDETEALIAVDVNSGKSRMAADQPDFILRTNLEAAEEIGRQLRLRNVGGLVVIDFIDMKSPADRDEVCRLMKKLAKEDRAKTKVLPLSQFGLMEMTRQREHESIKHQFYDPCPYCRGTGVVKSPETVSAEIQRKLYSVLRNKKYKNISVRVFVHPDILSRLKNTDAGHLDELESACRRDLSYRADPELHYESFRVIDADTGEVLN